MIQNSTNTFNFIFSVIVGALHLPQGAGGPRRRLTKLSGPDNSIHKKSSMVQIVNDDQLCMARAIGVGLAKQCVVPDETWRPLKEEYRELTNPEILVRYRQISKNGFHDIKDKNRQEQKNLAILLCQTAGVPTDRPGSLNDIQAFEDTLKVRIAVVAASLGNKFIRVPDNEHEDWPLLYLYLVDHEGVSHFHSIVNIAGFFSAIYFCERCFKQYNNKTEHRCETTCLTCKSQNCPETDTTMSCRSCHMVCRSVDCFERHLIEKTRKNGDKGDVTLSQCDEFWRCTTCKKVVNRFKRPTELHECTEWLCKCCTSWVTGDHRCYLFPEEPKKPVNKFIFFDFEATQDTIAQCAEGYAPKHCCQTPCKDCTKCQRCSKSWCGQPRHVPNFVVAQTVCEGCKDDPLTPDCTCDGCGNRCSKCDAWDKEAKTFVNPPCLDTCGFREVIFRGDATLEKFGDWLFSAQHKDANVLAHNMKVCFIIKNK